jgi:hypothetical protein
VGEVVLRDSTILGGQGGPPGVSTGGGSTGAVANGGDSIGWWAPVGAGPTSGVVERTRLAAGVPGVGGRPFDRLGIA